MFLFNLILIIIFLSNIFIFDGLTELNFYLTIFFSIFIFLFNGSSNKKMNLPGLSFFYLIFLIFSAISILFAIDIETAFKSFLLYFSYLLFFIYSYNHQDEFNKFFPRFILFICYFASILYLSDRIFHIDWFNNGASMFYPGYYHHEIANLLVLGIITGIYYKNYLSLLLFPIFLFSYSRSAYLAFLLYGLFNRLTKKTIFFFLIVITLTFFFLTTKEIKNILPNKLSVVLEDKFNIHKEKSFFGLRPVYFYYAFSSIKKSPWFGIGPGNFYFAAAERQVNWGENTTTAHNIFLDILAENGIFAGIFFILFFISLIRHKEKKLFFYLFITLSIIFFFDFAYRYNFFTILWFIFAGLLIKKENFFIRINRVFLILTAFVIFQVYFIFFVFFKNSLYSPKNFMQNMKLGYYYERKNELILAINYYKLAFFEAPIVNIENLDKLLELMIFYYGEEKGKEKYQEFLKKFLIISKPPMSSSLVGIIKEKCDNFNLDCW